MVRILHRGLLNWKFQLDKCLLITSAYPGSGKSTLAIRLSKQYRAKLLQIDELYSFLRLDKWFPEEIRGMIISEVYDYLQNGNLKEFYRRDSMIDCIEFLQTKEPEFYNTLNKHRFGEEFYLIGKDYYFHGLWPRWTDYLLEKYTHSDIPSIIEGGQLSNVLIKEWHRDLIDNVNPLIIIEENKYKAFYRKALSKMKEEYPNSTKLVRFIKALQWINGKRKAEYLQKIFARNEKKIEILKDLIKQFGVTYVNHPDEFRI